jgi:uncharacterized lipoprotein YbaY
MECLQKKSQKPYFTPFKVAVYFSLARKARHGGTVAYSQRLALPKQV